MVGMDKYRHSSGKRVKVKICGRLPSFHQILTSFMPIGATVIELRVFNKKEKKKKKKKNMDKMGKLLFVIILAKCGLLVKDLVHSLVSTYVVL